MALAIVLVVTGVSRSSAMVGLESLSYDGSLEFAGFSANNEVNKNDDAYGSDHRGGVNTRQRVGVNGQVTDNARFRLELGRGDGQFGRSLAGTSNGSNSIDNETANIRFHNAFIDLSDIYWGISGRLGRQYVGNPGDLVWNISPTDDNSLTFRAIDGLLLQKRTSIVNVDLFLGKAVENDTRSGTNLGDSSSSDSDINLNSLDVVFPSLVPGAKLNAGYSWGRVEKSSATSDNDSLQIWRVGINGGVRENMFTYRAEFFKNGGQDRMTNGTKVSYEGSAIDLGVGFNAPETQAGSFGVNANWLMASGDDKTGDDKDKSFHDFTEIGLNTSDRLLGEIFGKSNTLSASNPIGGKGVPLGQGIDTGSEGQGIDVLNLGLWWTPMFCKRSTLSLNWYKFDTVENGANSAVPNADSYGSEIDAVWNFRHSDNINVALGYAMFSPDDGVVGTTAGTPDDDVTELFSRLTVKWGNAANMTQIDPAK
jgi:hypothetical protein